MAGLTAVNQPVHVLDVDRKIQAAGWAQDALKSGKLTYWEVNEPFDDSNIKGRTVGLASSLKTNKPSIEPKGWATLAELIYKLPTDPISKAAGTWVIDSLTLANEHLKALIMYHAGKTKYTFDQWNALKIAWMDTLSVIRDLARENSKDCIVTVHERFKEEPGDKTLGVRMEAVKSGDDIAMQKTYVGQQDIKVWASIDGAFGDLIGAQMDEYYWLHVDSTNIDKPKWLCRVWPDGRRALRTSFMLNKAEWEPNFQSIWNQK
jgi:hypothetical protein